MGSAGSRGRRVTPASKAHGHDGDLLQNHTTDVKIQPELQDSGSLMDNEDLAELNRILNAGVNRRSFHKPFFSAYGFCYGKSNRDEDKKKSSSDSCTDEGHYSDHIKGVGYKERNQIYPLNDPQKKVIVSNASPQTSGTSRDVDPSCRATAVVPGVCDQPSVTVAVYYDAAEEELMSTIEREFG